MIKIGITGSIASGKTTVAKMFSNQKYPLFIADKEVKKIYNKNLFKKKISKKFKFNNDKNIKNKIKKILSIKKKYIKDLEKIIHPLVRKELKKFTQKNKGNKFLIYEIPLLIESRLTSNFDKIIFVNARKKLRLQRYLRKGKNKRIFYFLDKRQLKPSKKINYCDYVINNNNSLKKLKINVRHVKRKL